MIWFDPKSGKGFLCGFRNHVVFMWFSDWDFYVVFEIFQDWFGASNFFGLNQIIQIKSKKNQIKSWFGFNPVTDH